MGSVGPVLPVGLTEGDISFSYTPIGGQTTVVPVTVVPEPSTIAMLLVLGFIGICWRRRSA